MALSYDEAVAKVTAAGQPFEVTTIEIDGHPTRIWKNFPATIPQLFELSRRHGDQDWLVYRDERTSFEQHYRQVAALADCLRNRYDIAKGDRVAIAMRNYPEWSVAFWAITAIGAVAVPLNAWWTSKELAYGLTDSGSKLVFADAERLERIRAIDEPLPLQHIVAVRSEQVPEGCIDYGAMLAEAGEVAALPAETLEPEDLATLFYTSGTTGFPKGTMGTHRNFCSAAAGFIGAGLIMMARTEGAPNMFSSLQGQQQVVLLTTPLFHVTGCHGMMLNMLILGGKLVLMHKWDPKDAMQLIEREKVTLFGGVPTMVWQLLEAQRESAGDLSSVLNIGYGGAAAPPELLRQITTVMPRAGATTGWGITETSSTVSSISAEEYAARPDSVGRALPVYEIKVVDPDGRALPAGAVGEFWLRGPQVVKGYWNKPEATAASFTDGWFHTGDVGRIDEEGFIYIMDRLKDMIIRGGENVYCSEVEAALVEHPAVRGVCVFGVPHATLGEQVAAAVLLEAGAGVSEEELRAFVADKLAKFKIPERFWFRREPFPLGATGKVQKREVRQACLEQSP